MFFDPSFWLELALKMAMTAVIVVTASIVVERSGPFIGAMIAALPTAAGAVWRATAATRSRAQGREPRPEDRPREAMRCAMDLPPRP